MKEIVFLIEGAKEGGYTARALSESIFTEGETMRELEENIQDALICHFGDAASDSYVPFIVNR